MRKVTTGATWQLTNDGMVLEEENFYFVPENTEFAECKGSKTTESISSYPKEFLPYMTKVMDDAQTAYDAGELSKVADLTQDQLNALDSGRAAANSQNVLAGQAQGATDRMQAAMGARDTTQARNQAMWNAAGGVNQLTGASNASGNLGGSRQALSRTGMENDLGKAFYDIENQELARQTQAAGAYQQAAGAQQQMNTIGAQTLGQVGQVVQDQNQATLDSKLGGLQNLAGMYQGVVPRQTNTTQTGGK